MSSQQAWAHQLETEQRHAEDTESRGTLKKSEAPITNNTAPHLSEIERVMLVGDLSKLSPLERVTYYKAVCDSLGLNPLTRPFEYITLKGKLTFYARKDCTEQLRKINGVSITKIERAVVMEKMYEVIAYGVDKFGREDCGMGVVSIEGLRGDDLANAMMKAETKSKRRLTLSISGLNFLDESELETIPELKNKTHVKDAPSDAKKELFHEAWLEKLPNHIKEMSAKIIASQNISELREHFSNAWSDVKQYANRAELQNKFKKEYDKRNAELSK